MRKRTLSLIAFIIAEICILIPTIILKDTECIFLGMAILTIINLLLFSINISDEN